MQQKSAESTFNQIERKKQTEQISDQQLQELLAKLNAEEEIMVARLSLEELRRKIDNGEAVVLQDEEGNIIAFGVLWPIDNILQGRWAEVGTIWVSPNFRGQKKSEKILELIAEQNNGGKHLAILTHVDAMKRAAIKIGFKETTELNPPKIGGYYVLVSEININTNLKGKMEWLTQMAKKYSQLHQENVKLSLK